MKIKKESTESFGAGVCLLLVSFMLLKWGGEGSEAVRQGMLLCQNVIIPAMFPFFILSNMVISLELSRGIGKLLAPFMMPLFGLSGCTGTAILLGIIGGYPVGAKTAVALYQSGQCTEMEANHLLRFCNSAGPAFVLGVIATGMYHSTAVGLLLYVAHLGAGLTVGILYRGGKKEGVLREKVEERTSQEGKTPSFVSAFIQGVTGAMDATISVCAFILCFTVLLKLGSLSGVLELIAEILTPFFLCLGWDVDLGSALVVGFFELASGVSSLHVGTLPQQMAIISFFLGWGGLCVHCQVLSFLLDSGLSCKAYLLGSLLKGVVASVYGFILATVFLGTAVSPVAETMTGSVYDSGVVLGFVAVFGMIFLGSVLFLLAHLGEKKLLKKGRKVHEKGVY